jgi:hypothetical protein
LFDINGNLPPGVHEFTWDDLVQQFGWNEWRQSLLRGMLATIHHLKATGCRRVYIDGSFVTSKEHPGDYDACWERAGVTVSLLDPVLLDFSPRRLRQKAKFGGEWFPADLAADEYGTAFVEFFQLDRSDNPKGIVALNLKDVR